MVTIINKCNDTTCYWNIAETCTRKEIEINYKGYCFNEVDEYRRE